MIVIEDGSVIIYNGEGKIIYKQDSVRDIQRFTDEHSVIISEDLITFVRIFNDPKTKLPACTIIKDTNFKSVIVKKGYLLIHRIVMGMPVIDMYNEQLLNYARLQEGADGKFTYLIGKLLPKQLKVIALNKYNLYGLIKGQCFSYNIKNSKLLRIKSIPEEQSLTTILDELGVGR